MVNNTVSLSFVRVKAKKSLAARKFERHLRNIQEQFGYHVANELEHATAVTILGQYRLIDTLGAICAPSDQYTEVASSNPEEHSNVFEFKLDKHIWYCSINDEVRFFGFLRSCLLISSYHVEDRLRTLKGEVIKKVAEL